MDLLEYQAKELFRQVGIPTLPSQKISQPIDAEGLQLSYPVVLKSQVYQGDREKVGVRFAENTIDAIASAQAIFHLPIKGKYPEVVLAEPKYESDWEFYLAIVLDSFTRRPLLLGSRYGGMGVETKLEHMQQVIVDQEFSSFYARRLALKMGLKGALIQSVSAVIEKLYRLFVQQDLDWAEINPLAVRASGELMALDGKVTLNDAAIGRHSELTAILANSKAQAQSVPLSCTATPLNPAGTIGVLCNGIGLIKATLDSIAAANGKAASFIDLDGEQSIAGSEEPSLKQLAQGLDLIRQDKAVKVILINLLGSPLSNRLVAMKIASSLKKPLPSPAIVVRLVGSEFHQARQILLPLGVPVLERLDEAIAQAIAYACCNDWEVRLQSARLRAQSGEVSSSHSPVPSA